jgi:hypothetical protein
MVLGTPGALWWLLLIPLVILLYMLRARREPRIVPSTLLWERATRDLVARMPVRRLERSLLLLLQVLALAALTFALARPSVALPGLAGDAVVVVVRTTASMQATDELPTRLAAAQREALALVGRLGPRQQAAVVSAGRRPMIVQDFTSDRESLAAAIRGLRSTDAAGALDEAVALAASLRLDGRPARVHLFSDRAPADGSVRWHRVGRGAPNVAITSAAARADAAGAASLLVRIEAFGGPVPPSPLVVTLDGRPIARREVRPSPGFPAVAVFDLGRASGIVTVRLERSDALAADDRAVVAVGQEALPRVLVAGPPNPVLDAVLSAIPLGGLSRAERIAPAEWGRADLVVLDSLRPIHLPPGAYLLIGTLGENLPLEIEGSAVDQVVRSVAFTHPLTRLADLRGVRVSAAFSLRVRGGVSVAEGDVPLLWAYEGQGLRTVIVPFALQESDLSLHPAFPVLVANAIGWLAGHASVTAGDAPVLPAGPARTGTLIDPTGATRRLDAREGLFALPALDRVGLWRLRTDGWERQWVVSTVDASESNLGVADAPAATAADEAPRMAFLSLVPWLLGLAAVLIAGEWLLWTRTVPPDVRPVRGSVRRR